MFPQFEQLIGFNTTLAPNLHYVFKNGDQCAAELCGRARLVPGSCLARAHLELIVEPCVESFVESVVDPS